MVGLRLGRCEDEDEDDDEDEGGSLACGFGRCEDDDEDEGMVGLRLGRCEDEDEDDDEDEGGSSDRAKRGSLSSLHDQRGNLEGNSQIETRRLRGRCRRLGKDGGTESWNELRKSDTACAEQCAGHGGAMQRICSALALGLVLALGFSGCTTPIVLSDFHILGRKKPGEVTEAVAAALLPLGFQRMPPLLNPPHERFSFSYLSRHVFDLTSPRRPLDRFRGLAELHVVVAAEDPEKIVIFMNVREGTGDLAIADFVAEKIAEGLRARGYRYRIQRVQTTTIPNII
ncbi:MAG: hypothetical protein JSR82_21705 [Verrucomicrobia bacterium]|nr:hypothetical protein [Verrucomicrobiota bacterium]